MSKKISQKLFQDCEHYFTGGLQKLRLKTLEHQSLIHDVCLCYKIVHSFTHIISEFPVLITSRTRDHTKKNGPLVIGSNSSSIESWPLWNSLLPDIISSSTHTWNLDSKLAYLPSISTNIQQLNDFKFFSVPLYIYKLTDYNFSGHSWLFWLK